MTQNGMRQYDERMVGAPAILNGEVVSHAADPNAQAKALQVLTMAQRTADDHIETARRDAEQIHAQARAEAGQIVSEAQAAAAQLRDEADRILTRARSSAKQIAQEAETYAQETERTAGEVLAEAQERADAIIRESQVNARDIKQRAEQIYEDVVGGLTSKRQALQQQIESLESFDHEYRARLTAFMQQQMRALWLSQPQVSADGEAEIQEAEAVAPELTDGREDAEQPAPEQRAGE